MKVISPPKTLRCKVVLFSFVLKNRSMTTPLQKNGKRSPL